MLPHREETPLTEEQRAIVAHDRGPALVFAVAGAGKTTAMTHRIERLVREGVFPARSILATSFSKASVRDIKGALARWSHCVAVQTQTLHGVGWGILKIAQRRGYLPDLSLSQDEDSSDGLILAKTLSRAWREKVPFAGELDALDRPDFQTYVGVMKANLLYADLAKADLSQSAKPFAGPATAPPGFEWYRDLYGLYERVRLEERAITFDDMLLSGWEALHRWPDVLAEVRGRFQCILVDEFQDVNRVQAEMLDLLTFPHRDYMAIGDDDQTIYEWRGADPGFILDFGRRYGARKYFIGDNFRSHAAPLALANRVIARNVKREPKRLSLTRGFGGDLQVHGDDSPADQGRHIARSIREALDEGYRPDEIAVLVRLYAQTPYLEHALVETGIPYRVVGSSPFYGRPEVLTLLDYLRLVQAPDAHDWEARWHRIANKPTRYLPRPVCDAVAQAVKRGLSLPAALEGAAQEAPARTTSRLLDLAETLRWLSGALATLPAGATLAMLEQKIAYLDFLRRSSGFPETGAARAENVVAFLRYAHSQPTASALLSHLDALSASGIGQAQNGAGQSVSLLTVFRAKGLQWPVVFVPDCNQGTFPYGGPDEIEEERRLFYVALTRTQSRLHLHTLKTEPPSQFLMEADWQRTLDAVAQTRALLLKDPAAWRTSDALALARHAGALHLERYLETWWDPPHARLAAARLARLYADARGLELTDALGLSPAGESLWTRLAAGGTEAAGFPDLADFAPKTPPPDSPTPTRRAFAPGVLHVGGRVHHAQHGVGVILAIRGDRLSPRLEIQFGRGKPVVLPAKFVEMVGV